MAIHEPQIGPPPPAWSDEQRVLPAPAIGEGPLGVPGGELASPGRRGRLVGRPAGRPADLAAEPAHLGRHLPVVALPHPALVGTGARDDLQRRLPPDARRVQAPAGPRRPGSGGVDRDLGRHRADARAGDGRGRRHLVGRRAAHPRPQRLPRGVLLHVLLQPDHRRVRRCRGRVLRGHRDDRAGRRRAAARDAGRDGRPDGGAQPVRRGPHGGGHPRSQRRRPPGRHGARHPARGRPGGPGRPRRAAAAGDGRRHPRSRLRPRAPGLRQPGGP